MVPFHQRSHGDQEGHGDQGGKRGPGGHGDQGVPEKAMMTVVPILKTKVAKNYVEVNETKEVKNWFGALGRQDHQ